MPDSTTNKTLKVGTFGANTPDAVVPDNMIGNVIWYSPKYELFRVTNINNESVAEFTFEKYEAFCDANVIIFTSSNMESHMRRLMQENKKKSSPFSFLEEEDIEDDEDIYDDYEEEEIPLPRKQKPISSPSQNRGSSSKPRIQNTSSVARKTSKGDDRHTDDENSPANQKDPTRHLPVFMALTLIFTIIIMIVINFGEPIVNGVSTLLS